MQIQYNSLPFGSVLYCPGHKHRLLLEEKLGCSVIDTRRGLKSPFPLGSKGNLLYKAAVRSDFALCPILSDVSGPQLYITQQGMQ